MALVMPIAPNLVAATFDTEVLGVNHKHSYGFHPQLDRRPLMMCAADLTNGVALALLGQNAQDLGFTKATLFHKTLKQKEMEKFHLPLAFQWSTFGEGYKSGCVSHFILPLIFASVFTLI